MSAEDAEYKFSEFYDGTDKLLGEQHLNKLKAFVSQYSTQLQEIEEALEEALSQEWEITSEPIFLQIQPYEQSNILQIIRTDNKVFNKIMCVFASLCLEIQYLKELGVKQFYAPLRLFGETPVVNNTSANSEPKPEDIANTMEEGNVQLQFAKTFSLLLELNSYINRCNVVVKNVIQQLASLYHSNQKLYVSSFKGVHLQSVFGHLADLLAVLISLDEIVLANNAFPNALNLYKRMVKAIKSDPARYKIDEEKLWQVEKLLYTLKSQILDGRIYQNCIEQEFDSPSLIEVSQNKEFKKEFFLNITALFSFVNDRLRTGNETNHRMKAVSLCALYSFYISLFKDPSDKKFFKGIWELHKKVPIVHIYADVSWILPDFLRKTVPIMVKILGASSDSSVSFLKDYIKVLDKDFHNTVKMLYLQVSLWMVRIESNLKNRYDTLEDILEKRRDFIQTGVNLSYQIGNLYKEIVSLHLNLNIPLKTAHVRYLCQCLEILKAIQATFERRSTIIGESVTMMIQQQTSGLQRTFLPIKSRLESGKRYTDAKLDVLAAVNLAISMLSGTPTKERRLVIKLATQVIFQVDFIKDEEIQFIKEKLERMDALCEYQEHIDSACECSLIYWSKNMLPSYFSDLYLHPQYAHKLHYLFAAIRDASIVLKKSIHCDASAFVNSYRDEIHDLLKKHLIDPLCKDIQEDLLLHIHSHLKVSDKNAIKDGTKDFSRFFALRPLRSIDRFIDLKAHVTHELESRIYNLTTVSLNNWKTYSAMRNLAEEKYGLSFVETHLPPQTLEQGIDILEIMRNIHIFVARYMYNLHNQSFVEKTSENKSLNTINLTHVSNSIRTHGVGIMNTTVNFIFQFLKQKFVIFSQFLYDDHIKSPLYRDIRFFKEQKEQLGNKYPWDRALKFTKEIKKLGFVNSGNNDKDQKSSYLDQFRILITEIGNAIGYVRMIRNGGFQYVSNAIKFVPDLQDIVSFEELVKSANLSTDSTDAANKLDSEIDTLVKNFAGGTEYFKMLVAVFADKFRSEENAHLKNFYIIVPPLTINFVDHILQGKEKLSKKKPGGFFTDDGFVIGVAYILKLLDQYKQFDSLHWFGEIQNHYREEQKKVQAEVASSSNSKQKKEEQQTAVLTIKKLQSYQMEFDLLKFAFHGAKIFFND